MPDDPASVPAPLPRPEPNTTAGRRPVARGAVIAAVVAALLLGAGAVVAWRGAAARDDANRKHAAAARRTAAALAALRRAQSDLAAPRAAAAAFQPPAQAAIAATAHLVDLEVQLADRINRLQQAGASRDIETYNRIVRELNASKNDLVAASHDLVVPLEEFSKALERLPTARCRGKPAPTITWTAYGGNGLQCARLLVPLDYSAPGASQIVVTLVRRPAGDPKASLGPLLLNPGGPGASGIAFMREAILLLPPELLQRFDLIAFDPRGVGQSSPVDCADNLDPLFDADLTSPVPKARDAALDAIRRVVAGCATRTGPLLQHVDTNSAARDMDRMRSALGVKQLSYLGYSYGTYLGAMYADLFPSRVRAAVLDGAIDPRRASRTAALTSPDSFDNALREALDDCAATPSCPFNSGGGSEDAYDALMTRITTQSLVVGARRLGRNRAELAVVSGLYAGKEGWPQLMAALAQAAAGNGKPLSDLSDQYTGRRADGSYDNEFEAHYAINCIDLEGRLSPSDASDRVHRLKQQPGRFETVSLAFALPCAFWPAPSHPAPESLHAKGAAPILVIGGVFDPVTPIEGAKALASELDSGVLLRSESTGHTSFGRGNHCVDDIVISYLVDLKAPENGTDCAAG